MSRLSPLDVEGLNDEQRAVLDAIRSGPRGAGVGLAGPFGVWVRAPRIGNAVQALGAAARFETRLPDNVKEVAICTVGAHYRARFEFAAHSRMALTAGVAAAAVEAIRSGAEPRFERDGEALAYRVASELLTGHRLDDATCRQAVEAFAEEGLVELVTIVGYYCMVSLTLNAFEVPLADGMTDPFPDPAAPSASS